MEKMIKKLNLIFYFSYLPFIAILIFSGAMLGLVVISFLDQLSLIKVNVGHFLEAVFEPIMVMLFSITITISIFLACFNILRIRKSALFSETEKKSWTRLYLKMNVLANSVFYDYAYKGEKPETSVEKFLTASRDRIFGGRIWKKWVKEKKQD